MPRVKIRPIKNPSEFRQCQLIQEQVWGKISVSSEALMAAQKYGGVVLGAFVNNTLAGFLYAFLGRRHNRLIHWSHMMAVVAEHRDQGIGFRMKQAHRKLALGRGIKSICWTFDPLQGRNANLNIARLGARPEEYIVDCYGHFQSRIEKGLPSDRFVVNWLIGSPEVRKRLAHGPSTARVAGAATVNETAVNTEGYLRNRRLRLKLSDRKLIVEIPANADPMRSTNPQLAMQWRLEIRRIFQKYLANGYAVETFLPPAAFTEGRCAYVLSRSR